MIWIIISFVLFFIFTWLYCWNFKKQYINKKKWENEQELIEFNSKVQLEIERAKTNRDELIASIDQTIERDKIRQEKELEHQKELYNEKLKNFKKTEYAKINAEMLKEKQTITENFNSFKKEVDENIKAISLELEDYKAKQKIAAEEILRQREIEENKKFYSVNLTEEEKNDIILLNSIRGKMNKTEKLDKLIYDSYIARPVNDMVKRVLGGNKPSGIYKITRSTGEVYIGKSTDVAARWVQHCKTAFHVGTISSSTLHSLMEQDGIDTFTFQLLEEVEKDKLTSREKYWIEFYDSNKTGLNIRKG